MPRFHFDVCTDGVTAQDHEGVDLPSAEAAQFEAARAAVQMLRERAERKAERADISIAVRDGTEPVCTVEVALKIQ